MAGDRHLRWEDIRIFLANAKNFVLLRIFKNCILRFCKYLSNLASIKIWDCGLYQQPLFNLQRLCVFLNLLNLDGFNIFSLPTKPQNLTSPPKKIN